MPCLIQLVTGSAKKAGTDGPIWICLHESKDLNSGQLIFKSEDNKTIISKGTNRKFRFQIPKLNCITEVEVSL